MFCFLAVPALSWNSRRQSIPPLLELDVVCTVEETLEAPKAERVCMAVPKDLCLDDFGVRIRCMAWSRSRRSARERLSMSRRPCASSVESICVHIWYRMSKRAQACSVLFSEPSVSAKRRKKSRTPSAWKCRMYASCMPRRGGVKPGSPGRGSGTETRFRSNASTHSKVLLLSGRARPSLSAPSGLGASASSSSSSMLSTSRPMRMMKTSFLAKASL
mmetsp:Transcript_58944/g.127501  ORF Transcript_58944/g.127501 Transcript_58944/m.127501 type:complete len:217 (-) Transcript_58944:410-1060(-)